MARFTLPRDLYHGKGALEALKTFEGKRAIVCVGGGSMKRFGFLDRAVDYLKEAGMEVQLFEGIESDPSAAESPEPLPDSAVAASSPPVLPHATRLTIMVLANNAEITFFFIWCPPCVLRSFWCVPLLFLSRLTNHLSFIIIRFV